MLIRCTLYLVEEPVEEKSANVNNRARRTQNHNETQQIWKSVSFLLLFYDPFE